MTDALPEFVVAALITFVALFLLVPAALLLGLIAVFGRFEHGRRTS